MASVAEEVTAESTPALSVGALADLYGRLAPSIRRLCLGYMRDPDDAEDITQEAFVRLAARFDTLDGDIAAYAFRIARNLCCDELTRRKRRESFAQQAMDEPCDGGDAVVARTESRDLLERVRKSLTSEEFALFVQIASGHSQAEVADNLRITETNVSVKLCRARKKVRLLFGGASAVAALTLWRRLRSAFTTAPARTPLAAVPAAFLSAAMIGAITLGTLTLQPWGSHVAPAHDPTAGVSIHASSDAARVAVPAKPRQGSSATTTTPAAPTSGPVTSSSLVQSLVDPGQNATPQETGITSIAVSPGYSNDHSILAAGTLAVGCGNPVACNVLFRSSDGGRTWSHLAGRGFAGGTLLLPPAFATEHVVYTMGTVGLQVSRDGGASFSLAVPGPVAAAIAPSSTPAATDIVLGTSPLTIYHSASGLITPGPLLPLGTPPPDALAYEPGSATLLATADVQDAASGLQDGEVIRCASGDACSVVATAPNDPALQLVVGRGAGAALPTAAFSAGVLLTSWDDGNHFSSTGSPIDTRWRAALVTGTGGLIVIAQTADAAETARAFTTSDPSLPLSAASTEGIAAGASFMASVSLPDGSILAGLEPNGEAHLFGLVCSPNGRVWAATC